MPESQNLTSSSPAFLAGGGEMGQLIREFNWSATELGPPDTWPQSLRTTLSIILNSKFPMFLFWGPNNVCFYNDAYRPSLGQDGKHPTLLGAKGVDGWQEIWAFISPIIDTVLAGGEATFYEDQLLPIYRNNKLEDVYWSFSYSPVSDETGKPAGVFVTCTETTGKVMLNKQLTINQENIRNMVRQAPVGMCIVKGNPLMVEEANDLFLEIIGKERGQFKTIPYWVVNAEAAPYYEHITDRVIATGETYHADEHEITLIRKGKPETINVDFVYEPMKSHDGTVDGIMIVAIDITDKVASRKIVEQASAELYASNEEMTAANEELISSNEELSETQQHLKQMVDDLAASESRFRFLVQGAPVAIGVLSGRELTIESANDKILQLWGKSRDIVGTRLAAAIPELKGQPFLKILDDVYTSGQAYHGNEEKAMLMNGEELTEYYFNFIYEPLKDAYGTTNTIMIVAIDATGQVNARKELERAEEMVRFSVEAANAATWYLDTVTREFIVSDRLKEIFGFDLTYNPLYEDILARIPNEYKKSIHRAIEQSIATGQSYSMEHPLLGNDSNKQWVRALGKLYPAVGHRNAHFSGLIIDITEQKQDEIRKNDFIGMVSHELKTPLTSLTAIVQVLNAKLKTSSDPFIAGALDKANTQVKKMGNMINGFLNISRLESGKILIEKQPFDIDQLLNEMVDEIKITTSTHVISIQSCGALIINADKDKIGSVISNLLSNAVKYSPKGKKIEVGCKKIDNQVQLSITDEGMGVKAQDLEKLFDRYYRVESKHTAHISGFGIGLYLSAEIIHHHDGKIWVESESGTGSTFHFTLPL